MEINYKRLFPFIYLLFNSLNCLFALCSDKIFCTGDVLRIVQMSRIFNDSKTFVDLNMKRNRREILASFTNLMRDSGGKPDGDRVNKFVQENFEGPGKETELWTPPDWKEDLEFFDKVSDPSVKQWLKSLNAIWKNLGRRIKHEVNSNEDKYSIIYLPEPFIIPGGRFREMYYWDSHWIIKGLLRSQMHSTVKGMLKNFLSLVQRFGFVPNGGRKYYLSRSQPPVLIQSFKLYFEATGDYEFLSESIDTLAKEFNFWLTNRTITVEKGSKSYILAKYSDESLGPRPESFFEDFNTASHLQSEDDKNNFYSHVKSAAESGWDFSSRWFAEGSTDLKDIQTKNIVPVDLNALICSNAEILSTFYEKLDRHKEALIYARIGRNWFKAINKILWHEDIGIWLDYDAANDVRRNHFYPSNLFPIWTKCYDESRIDIVTRVVDYLRENGIDQFPGGIPASMVETGQQWDYPNAWPPSQHAVIQGLDESGDPCARHLAKQLAHNLISNYYQSYARTEVMYEKYDAATEGKGGSGGEYPVQGGFGWTNGIILDLVHRYPDVTHDRRQPQPLLHHFCTTTIESAASITKLESVLIVILLSIIVM